jgi:hypothetical protein
MANALARPLVAVGFALMIGLAAVTAMAGPVEDLDNLKEEYKTLQSSFGSVSDMANTFFDSSRKLRELDKAELEQLIEKVCAMDLGPNADEERRLAESLQDNVVERVSSSYKDAYQAGERANNALRQARKDIDVLVKNIKPLTSIDQVKDAASSLLRDATALQENAERLQVKFADDEKSLTNVSNGTMNGSNKPKIRAAMVYGVEKHKELTCPDPFKKEVELPSGKKADCVSFAKDNCAVYEFKPDKNFTESSAADWAKAKYLNEVTEFYGPKGRQENRDLANDCKKDASGNPEFEPKGKVYPACKLDRL